MHFFGEILNTDKFDVSKDYIDSKVTRAVTNYDVCELIFAAASE